MSEPTFPFAAVDDPAEDDAAPATRRRTLLALGGLGVVALGVAGVLVLTGPDEAELDLGLPTGAAAAAAAPPPVPTASPSAVAPATAEVRRGRDPFRAPGGAGSTAGGGAAQPGVAEPTAAPAPPALQEPGPVPVGPVPDLGGGSEPDPALDLGPDRGASEEPAADVRRLGLVRVAGAQTAVLAVDGTVLSVRVGDSFGPGGALLLLSLQQGPDEGQWTAVVQQGTGEPFDVVTGQPATAF